MDILTPGVMTPDVMITRTINILTPDVMTPRIERTTRSARTNTEIKLHTDLNLLTLGLKQVLRSRSTKTLALYLLTSSCQ